MSKRNLLLLLASNLSGFVLGNGLIPILPVYALAIGATPATAGYYLGFSFLWLSLGAVLGGFLCDRTRHRTRVLMSAGVLAVVATWSIGQSTSVLQLTAGTAALWFLGGIGLTVMKVLAALLADSSERGRVFGLFALTSSLGFLVGGLITGPLVDLWGYQIMFTCVATLPGIWVVCGLAIDESDALPNNDILADGANQPTPDLSRERPSHVHFLWLAGFIAAVAGFVGLLGTSLAMKGMGFSATAITSTAAVSGAIGALVLPTLGRLSDRLGRKVCLVSAYVTGAAGLIILAASTSVWQFCVAAACLRVLASTNTDLGTAWVTDLAPQASLGKGISSFNAVVWTAGIAGFAGAGATIEKWGIAGTLIVAAGLCLVATLFLFPVLQREPLGDIEDTGNFS